MLKNQCLQKEISFQFDFYNNYKILCVWRNMAAPVMEQ